MLVFGCTVIILFSFNNVGDAISSNKSICFFLKSPSASKSLDSLLDNSAEAFCCSKTEIFPCSKRL